MGRMQGVEVKREADEEDGEKSVLRLCACVCVLTCLPFTFCLTVWCCYECWRRTCEEPDSGQQNGTPAWVFTTPPQPPPSLSFTLSSWPAAKTHIFSLCVCVYVYVREGGGLDESGTKHIKSSRMEYVVVSGQVMQLCRFLHSSLTSLNHFILQLPEHEQYAMFWALVCHLSFVKLVLFRGFNMWKKIFLWLTWQQDTRAHILGAAGTSGKFAGGVGGKWDGLQSWGWITTDHCPPHEASLIFSLLTHTIITSYAKQEASSVKKQHWWNTRL